jgi:hypothetical protein
MTHTRKEDGTLRIKLKVTPDTNHREEIASSLCIIIFIHEEELSMSKLQINTADFTSDSE